VKRGGPLTRRTGLARVPFARKPAEGPAPSKPWPKQHRDEIPPPVRLRVKLRADYHCEACGVDMLTRSGGELHHRQPRGMGGRSHPERHSPANLLFLCPGCHRDIEVYRAAAYGFGRLVHRWLNPAHQNVLIHGRGWVRLDADGSYAEVPE
jgi:5-methylcytosine-specific restriction protein A